MGIEMDKKQLLLANMHTFNVAAKHLSFTTAGIELNISQSAVSHRIKNLEIQLGFKVFIRLTRKLQLTPEGMRLQGTIASSFDNIFAELEDIKFNELRGKLFIGTSPAFAAGWLLPRMASFQERYPNLDVQILAKINISDFQHEAIDLGIYYSDGNYPDHYSEHLFDEKRLPVCTPEYAQRTGLLTEGVKALNKVTFIQDSNSNAWKNWLSWAGIGAKCIKHKYSFNHNELGIIAATQSLGLALGRLRVISHSLQSGELIAPFAAMDSTMGYDLACAEGLQYRAKFKAFSDWIKQEIAAENSSKPFVVNKQ